MSCGLELDGYQCHAGYTSLTGEQSDITGLVTWSTSDPGIATVNSVGFVTVLQTGEVAIRFNYRGDEMSSGPLQVRPGGSRRDYRTLSGTVTDAQDGSKLANVSVKIVDGPNNTYLFTTGSDGTYQFYDLQPGTFTVRFAKAGYTVVDRQYTLTGETFNSLGAELTKSTP